MPLAQLGNFDAQYNLGCAYYYRGNIFVNERSFCEADDMYCSANRWIEKASQKKFQKTLQKKSIKQAMKNILKVRKVI